MKEAVADLWEIDADLKIITTNGFVKQNGRCVMGRGCAREARDLYPGIDKKLGSLIQLHGNRPVRLRKNLATLPVKHHWNQKADLGLIEESIKLLVKLVDDFGYQKVVIPRPGCGNGQLDWSVVKPVIEPYLDDRFVVVTK